MCIETEIDHFDFDFDTSKLVPCSTLHIVHHAHFNEIHVWDVKGHGRVSAVPLHKRVHIVDGQRLQPGGRFLGLHIGVADHIREARLLRFHQVGQLLSDVQVGLFFVVTFPGQSEVHPPATWEELGRCDFH